MNRELVRALLQAIRSMPVIGLRFGTVAAITAPTLTITMGGSTFTAVQRLRGSYAVNDNVAILQAGPTLLVLGVVG